MDKLAGSTRSMGAPQLGGEIAPPLCSSFHRAIEFIGRRWMGAILLVLMRGPRRFNALLGAIPDISDRLLTERLRELEALALVERRVLPGSPVKVEYELTTAGRDLQTVLTAVANWGHQWMPAEDEQK